MANYIITTDTTADLPESYLQEHGINVISLTYTIDGVTYSRGNDMPTKEFYDKMRNGSMPTTSQANPDDAKTFFTEMIEKYDADILHIAFSSGLSGTYNSTRLAVAELEEENIGHKIVVVDSLCASLGEGLLVHKALENMKKGMSLEENAGWVENHKLNLIHNFTVDDLFHLSRGGRLSKTVALIGTMISLKPVLHVDDEGHLVALSKVRGRKKAIQALVDSLETHMGSFKDQNDTIFICHGDCEEEANYMADKIRERYNIQDILVGPIGPTIGAHAGPGTMAVFFLGDQR